MAERQIEKWITVKGRRVPIYADKGIVSEHSGDTITRKMALDSWARNASQIKKASQGEKYTGGLYSIGLNDEAKAALIKAFVKGHSVKDPTYRGIENLSDAEYDRYTTVGEEIEEKGLSSWTTSKATAAGHGQLGKGITFVKETPTENARSFGNITGTDIENEVIVLDSKCIVDRVEKSRFTTFVYLR